MCKGIPIWQWFIMPISCEVTCARLSMYMFHGDPFCKSEVDLTFGILDQYVGFFAQSDSTFSHC